MDRTTLDTGPFSAESASTMMTTTDDNSKEVPGSKTWKKVVLDVSMILLVLGLAVVIFIFRDKLSQLGSLGYLGIFLISLASCASIVLPVPAMLLIFAFGATFAPVFVGLVAALGGTLGETTGYVLGHTGRRLLPGNRVFDRTEVWMKRWGTKSIFVFALVPFLPIDIIGVVSGSLHFPLWKFWIACFLGKMVLYTAMALAGAWGYDAVLKFFGP